MGVYGGLICIINYGIVGTPTPPIIGDLVDNLENNLSDNSGNELCDNG